MLGSLLSRLVDGLAPFSCIQCAGASASPAAPLCRTCHDALPWWRRVDGCPRCGWLSPAGATCPGCYSDGSPLDRSHALLRYEAPADLWIPGFKRRASSFGPPLRARIALEYLAAEMARHLAGSEPGRPDCVIPIALHPRRRRKRGFNHADLIARQIARALDVGFAPTVLERIRDTPPQAALRLHERRANVRGAFSVRASLEARGHVWLVDDVLTTGATLDSAAEACLDAGAHEIHAVTIAATPARAKAARPAYHASPSSRPPASTPDRRTAPRAPMESSCPRVSAPSRPSCS